MRLLDARVVYRLDGCREASVQTGPRTSVCPNQDFILSAMSAISSRAEARGSGRSGDLDCDRVKSNAVSE